MGHTLMYAETQEVSLDAPTHSTENSHYLMINRLEIKNFRCYKDLTLSLKRFNILVGKSGSGKTALMEAMFMLGGSSPEIYFRIRQWRGFSKTINLTGTREQYQSLFRDLFYNFEQETGAVLQSSDSESGSRRLEILYADSKEYRLDLKNPEPHAFTLSPINFKWIVDGRVHNTSISFIEGKFTISGAAPVAPLAYYNPFNFSAVENANAFSSLSRRFRSTSLVKAIATIFPAVKDLTLELIGGEPVLCVETELDQKLPIGALSGGVNKFVTIALAILSNPYGTVIIDEIESGFYYADMPFVWTALVDLCMKEHVQLVVSTHSAEFLKAAAPILAREDISKESQLLRSELDDNGRHTIRRIPSRSLEAATSMDFEIR